jgi:hypothetical protein
MGLWSRIRQALASFGAKALNEYFANASKCWALGRDTAAYEAALAAAKTAAGKQRCSMVGYVHAVAKDMEEMVSDGRTSAKNAQPLETSAQSDESVEFWVAAAARYRQLADAIIERDWSVQDALEARRRLAEIDPAYMRAMCPVAPDVFVRRHPGLFK